MTLPMSPASVSCEGASCPGVTLSGLFRGSDVVPECKGSGMPPRE